MLVMLGSLMCGQLAQTICWLAGCWMILDGLSHMTVSWQAWWTLSWNGPSHLHVIFHFLVGQLSFVYTAVSDFQAHTEGALNSLQPSACVTFVNIPWTNASHIVKSRYKEWRYKLHHLIGKVSKLFFKGHVYKESKNL